MSSVHHGSYKQGIQWSGNVQVIPFITLCKKSLQCFGIFWATFSVYIWEISTKAVTFIAFIVRTYLLSSYSLAHKARLISLCAYIQLHCCSMTHLPMCFNTWHQWKIEFCARGVPFSFLLFAEIQRLLPQGGNASLTLDNRNPHAKCHQLSRKQSQVLGLCHNLSTASRYALSGTDSCFAEINTDKFSSALVLFSFYPVLKVSLELLIALPDVKTEVPWLWNLYLFPY